MVLTSSVAAVAYGRDDLPASHVYTEADWTNADNVSAYTKSKTLAERVSSLLHLHICTWVQILY